VSNPQERTPQSSLVDLHVHIEGNSWPDAIQRSLHKALKKLNVTSTEFDCLFPFIERVWEESPVGTLQAFINRLATSLIRMGLLVIYTLGIEHNKSAIDIRLAAEKYLGDIVDETIQSAKMQGLAGLNMLFSPENMAIDGDLSEEAFASVCLSRVRDGKNFHEKERDLYHRFHTCYTKIKQDKHHTCDQYFLTADQYVEIVHNRTKQYGVWSWERQKGDPVVFRTLSFRRDQDEKKLVGVEMLNTVDWVEHLFVCGRIDMVDICGNETRHEFLLEKYVPFLKELEKRGIPYSLHFLEIPDQNPKNPNTDHFDHIAMQNAMSLVGHKLKPLIVAHAVRLGRNDVFTKKVWEYVQTHRIGIILCLSSNGATGSDGTDIHPLLKVLKACPELFSEMRGTFGLGSDDPTVISVSFSTQHMDLEHEFAAQQFAETDEKISSVKDFFILSGWELFMRVVMQSDEARRQKHDELVKHP